MNRVREQHATYTSVEGRPLAEGDFAQASMDGKPKNGDDKTQPVHMDEVLIEIGGKNTVPEFTEHLRGANAGDEPEFEAGYPDDVADNAWPEKHSSTESRFTPSSRRICRNSTMTSPRNSASSPASIRCAGRFATTCKRSAGTMPSAKLKTN